jgi:hypothetical protein
MSERKLITNLKRLLKEGRVDHAFYKELTGDATPEQINSSDWRKDCDHAGELSTKAHPFLLDGLVPRKALTIVSSPSFNGKTWFVLQMCKAISTGEDLWGFGGPKDEEGYATPVPVLYHVPEMAAYLVKDRTNSLEISANDNFLFRTMERGLWTLDDARMIASANGRLIVLDTVGYFNPADTTNDYQQAVRFATLIYNLINAGAEGVIALYHPPKMQAMKNGKLPDFEWTLENSVLGSAGYGGILRSCLRVRNMNPDKNDKNLWLYVQGMKNPGLKQFTLRGIPLSLDLPPGECPPWYELAKQIKNGASANDPQEVFLEGLVKDGVGVREIKRKLNEQFGDDALSIGTVSTRRAEIIAKAGDAPDTQQLGIEEITESYAQEFSPDLIEIVEEGELSYEP